jgi:hypothetical protein
MPAGALQPITVIVPDSQDGKRWAASVTGPGVVTGTPIPDLHGSEKKTRFRVA